MADLTTTAKVREYVKLAPAGDDQLLARLIAAASAFVVQVCGWPILQASYIEPRNGHGGPTMVPRYPQVTAVSGVAVDGVELPARPAPGQRGYYLGDGAVELDGGAVFTRGRGNVILRYTAGYAATPADLEQAVIDLVALKYKQRDKVGLQGEQIGQAQVTYTFSRIPADVREVLQRYTRVVPV